MARAFFDPKPAASFREQATARHLDRVAWLMDRAITIPGTNVSVGLDALLGLLPVGGDLATGLIQAGLVVVMLGQYKVPREVAFKMMANVLIDTAVGSIPVVGDFFDVLFKANTRNVRLLDPYRNPGPIGPGGPGGPVGQPYNPLAGTSWTIILPVALAMLAMLGLVLVGLITLIVLVVRGLTH